jgi:hypothetical protein
MYIDKISSTYNGQVHTQYLLRTSKRDGKKIIKTTLLNLTRFGKETCESMVYALKNKKSLAHLLETSQQQGAPPSPIHHPLFVPLSDKGNLSERFGYSSSLQTISA